jgi:hypothetical protein
MDLTLPGARRARQEPSSPACVCFELSLFMQDGARRDRCIAESIDGTCVSIWTLNQRYLLVSMHSIFLDMEVTWLILPGCESFMHPARAADRMTSRGR